MRKATCYLMALTIAISAFSTSIMAHESIAPSTSRFIDYVGDMPSIGSSKFIKPVTGIPEVSSGFISSSNQEVIPKDAIHIKTEADLKDIGNARSDNYYVLDNDINLTTSWNPITGFEGVLDGRGFSINNLYAETNEDFGLFMYTNDGAEIKNLAVYIGTLGLISNENGDNCVGGLIGNAGDIIIKNCYVFGGSISATGNVGGLIGRSSGTLEIINSYVLSDISTKEGAIGGLVGDVYNYNDVPCIITSSFFSGKINSGNATRYSAVGGLIGSCSVGFNISKSYVKAELFSVDKEDIYSIYSEEDGKYVDVVDMWGENAVGGLVGRGTDDNTITRNSSVIVNSYFDGFIEAKIETSLLGQYGHENATGGLVGKTNDLSVKNSGSWGSIAVKSNYDGSTDKYTRVYTGGIVGCGTAITIDSAYSNIDIQTYDNTTFGVLESNMGGIIGQAENYEWSSGFSCKLNNCYTEGNLINNSKEGAVGGLIGRDQNNNGISNDIDFIEKSYSLSDVEAMGKLINVGGLIGNTNGFGSAFHVIKNCFFSGSMRATATESGVIGGIVGSGSVKVLNCYVTSDISITGLRAIAGGIIGLCSGFYIKDSYNTGVVSAITTDFQSYPSCVSGGIVGEASYSHEKYSILDNCFVTNIASVSSGDKCGGIIGLLGCDIEIKSKCSYSSVNGKYVNNNGSNTVTGSQLVVTDLPIPYGKKPASKSEQSEYIAINTDIVKKGDNYIDSIPDSGILPSYNNNILNKTLPDVPGDAEVKNMILDLNGFDLTINGKMKVENAKVIIPASSTLKVGSIEVGTNGKIIVDGKLLSGGHVLKLFGGNGNNGGYIYIGKNGRADVNNIEMHDYSEMDIYGDVFANDFLIKTKNNQSNFADEGTLWIKGNFEQKNNGLLVWTSGNDNFTPESGFTIILENANNGRHNLNFETPKQSYIYNLYIDRGQTGDYDNTWAGNPAIKGVIRGVYKTGTLKGYNFLTGIKQDKEQFIKQVRNEMSSVMAGSQNGFQISYGIESLGSMSSDSNRALQSYLFFYLSGIEALSPGKIGTNMRTWSENITIKDKDGKDRDIKLAFNDLEAQGQRLVSISYTDKDKSGYLGLFGMANAGALKNAITKYMTDQYTNVICDYFMAPIDGYIQNQNAFIAQLIWEGVRLADVPGGIAGVREPFEKYIKSNLSDAVTKKTSNIKSAYNHSRSLAFLSAKSEARPFSLSQARSVAIKMTSAESSVQDGVISFADEYLAEGLREELGLSSTSDVTTDMLSTIETLDLSEKYITNISGIEYCTNLQRIDLSGNSIYDIAPLLSLTNLEQLDLSGNIVEDIKDLEGLTNLNRLMLTSNRIQDISTLARLRSLKELSLAYNSVLDISSLSGLTYLEVLNLTNNNLTDIDALDSLLNLNILYCGRNNISNIASIGDLDLEILDISSNDISEITSLNTVNIQKLNISDNEITDISTLQSASKLTHLDICDNMVENIECLDGLQLQELRLNNNLITNIGIVVPMSDLKVFECADNDIEDYDILRNNTALQKLNIQGGYIDDFSFIAPLTDITDLNMSNCGLFGIDLIYLRALTNLKNLDISSNQICDMAEMSYLNGVVDLNISNNFINDLLPLMSLNKLENLNISFNPITLSSKNDNVLAVLAGKSVDVINQQVDIVSDGIYFMDDVVDIVQGETYEQNVSCIPLSAKAPELSWSSSDESIATVMRGVVTGRELGIATITAATIDGEFTASFEVMITQGNPNPADQLVDTINNYCSGTGSLNAVRNDDTVTVTGAVTDADSSLELDIAVDEKVIWEASITSDTDFGGNGDALICLIGEGEFEIADGGLIKSIGKYGRSISAYDPTSGGNPISTIIVNGGEVSSTGEYGITIFTWGDVIVNEGIVSAVNGGVAILSEIADSHVTVNGGKVSATGDLSEAIHINGDNSIVTVDGSAVVSATECFAISTYGENNGVNVVGGVVLAYGGSIEDVINIKGSGSDFDSSTGDGVIIAWDKDKGATSYEQDTNIDLVILPVGCATWDKVSDDSGIKYINGANNGFFPIKGVTVTVAGGGNDKLEPSLSDLLYDLTAVNYNGLTRPVAVTKNNNIGDITVKYNGGTDEPIDSGTYSVTVEIAANNDYDATILTLGDYKINKAPLTLNGGTVASKTYDATVDADVTSVIFTGLQNGEDLYIGTDYNITNAVFNSADAGNGNKTVTATVALMSNGSHSKNYILSDGNLSIANQTIEVADYTAPAIPGGNIAVNSLVSALPQTVMGIGVNSETVSGTIEWFSDATRSVQVEPSDLTTLGNVTFYWRFTATDANYTSGSKDGSVDFNIVEGNPQSLMFNGVVVGGTINKTYGDASFTYTASNSSSNGGTITYSSGDDTVATVDANGMVTIIKPGMTTITATAAAVPGTWIETGITYALIISKKTVTVKAENKTATVGNQLPKPSINYGGFVNSDTMIDVIGIEAEAEYAASASTAMVGTFPIVITTQATLNIGFDEKYTLSHQDGTLTVQARSGGGNSSGGGNTTQPITPPAEEDTSNISINGSSDSTSGEKINIPAELNNNTGEVNIRLDEKTTETLISNAIKVAEDQGSTDTPVVTLNLSDVNGAGAAVLDVNAAQTFSNSEVALTVKLPDADITLSSEALAELTASSDNGNTPITIEASVVPMKDLSGMQAAQVKEYETVVNVDIFVGENKVDVPVTISLPYSLKSNEDPNAVCVWHLDDNGNLTELQGVYDATTGMITFTINHQSYFVVGYDPVVLWKNIFNDVSKSDWFYDAVAYANYYELFSGKGDGKFAPQDSMTRGMFTTVLWNLENKPVTSGASLFTDVPFGMWYTDSIVWASENGIVSGIGNGKFVPNKEINRQEMAVMLTKYAKFKDYDISQNRDMPEYTDISKIESWAEDAVRELSKAGVINGSNNEFKPLKNATRAEVTQVFKNFQRLVPDK